LHGNYIQVVCDTSNVLRLTQTKFSNSTTNFTETRVKLQISRNLELRKPVLNIWNAQWQYT